MIDTVKHAAYGAQAGMGATNIMENPEMKNAILQLIILLVTWGLGELGNRRKSKTKEEVK